MITLDKVGRIKALAQQAQELMRRKPKDWRERVQAIRDELETIR